MWTIGLLWTEDLLQIFSGQEMSKNFLKGLTLLKGLYKGSLTKDITKSSKSRLFTNILQKTENLPKVFYEPRKSLI